MASIAVRVEIGEDQDAGVARSSRAGTNLKVKAGPTSRFAPGLKGRAPRIQTFRNPFFRRTVVMVAVDTWDKAATASGVRDIEREAPVACGVIRATLHQLIEVASPFLRTRFHFRAKQARG